MDPQEAVEELQAEFLRVLRIFSGGRPLPSVVSAKAQKWGSAFRADVLQDRSVLDPESRIAACGDFCVQSSAEGALLSGRDLADKILAIG